MQSIGDIQGFLIVLRTCSRNSNRLARNLSNLIIFSPIIKVDNFSFKDVSDGISQVRMSKFHIYFRISAKIAFRNPPWTTPYFSKSPSVSECSSLILMSSFAKMSLSKDLFSNRVSLQVHSNQVHAIWLSYEGAR